MSFRLPPSSPHCCLALPNLSTVRWELSSFQVCFEREGDNKFPYTRGSPLSQVTLDASVASQPLGFNLTADVTNYQIPVLKYNTLVQGSCRGCPPTPLLPKYRSCPVIHILCANYIFPGCSAFEFFLKRKNIHVIYILLALFQLFRKIQRRVLPSACTPGILKRSSVFYFLGAYKLGLQIGATRQGDPSRLGDRTKGYCSTETVSKIRLENLHWI